MAIKCDICKEEVNSLRTFSMLVTGTIGGTIAVGMFLPNSIYQFIGTFFGLCLALKLIYDFNPLHWRHTRVTGKLLNIIAVKQKPQ